VNDASTSRLMSDFYARWVKDPADGKAEALRQTQIALLKGPAASTAPGSGRGFESKPEPTSAGHDAGYSHPFYWRLGDHSKAAIGYHFKTGHRETA
jgi:CHAT domain-containing protein